MIDFNKIIKRIKSIKNITKNFQVAELFNLSPQDFSKRKNRGTLLPLVIEWGINQRVDLHWLLTGEGEPYRKNEIMLKSEAKNPGLESNTLELEHMDIVRMFKDKARAKNANIELLQIEQLDRETFIEVVGYIKGVANNLKISSGRQVYIGPDRRSGFDRRKEYIPELTPEEDRRSGFDRRVAGLKS